MHSVTMKIKAIQLVS